MEHAVSSFFHMICGIILFATALTGLMFGAEHIAAYVRMQQSLLVNKASGADGGTGTVVTGDWVLAFLLSEPEMEVSVRKPSGTVYESAFDVPLAASFQVEFEYEPDGSLKTVCFAEQ